MTSIAISADDILCESVRGYADIHHVLRRRAEELKISRATIDHLAGIENGYAGKLLADPPMVRAGWPIACEVLEALGLKMAIAIDQDAVARMRHRWVKEIRKAPRVLLAPSPAERAGDLRRAQTRRAGKIRMQRLSKPERVELARAAAVSRWSRKMPASDLASIGAAA